MIVSFRDRRTNMLFDGEQVPRIDPNLAKKVRRRLELLKAAKRIEDLYFPPSNQFHVLDGFNPKRYAIWMNKQ
jgi:proteic killer suppression protein